MGSGYKFAIFCLHGTVYICKKHIGAYLFYMRNKPAVVGGYYGCGREPACRVWCLHMCRKWRLRGCGAWELGTLTSVFYSSAM